MQRRTFSLAAIVASLPAWAQSAIAKPVESASPAGDSVAAQLKAKPHYDLPEWWRVPPMVFESLDRWDFVVQYHLTAPGPNGVVEIIEARHRAPHFAQKQVDGVLITALSGEYHTTITINGELVTNEQSFIDSRCHAAMNMGLSGTMDKDRTFMLALSLLSEKYAGYRVSKVRVHTHDTGHQPRKHIGNIEFSNSTFSVPDKPMWERELPVEIKILNG